MIQFFSRLLENDFMPHGHCYFWKPELVWLHVVADGLIAAAYYSIPVALVYFVRKRKDIAFNWMFLMFGAFIFACGTTHVMAIWTLWVPTYRLDGMVKLVTAVLSVGTAIILWPLIPRALGLPSPQDLEKSNLQLRRQVLERKMAEQRVHQLNAELERRVAARTGELRRSNEELQQFAYVASHDLQEPLRMVTSYTQLLERRYRGKLDSDADEIISHAVDGAQRMHELVNGLLQYSRVDIRSGEMEAVDCTSVTRQVMSDLRMMIDECGAVVSQGPLPTLVADATQLRQVFQNLLVNACKFRGDDPPRIQIEAERDGAWWQFSVRDNGIGLRPEHRDRIFVIFQRLHARAEYPGTGIGLAICKKIVERHGGRIWVESESGTGSVFYFTLPADRAMAA